MILEIHRNEDGGTTTVNGVSGERIAVGVKLHPNTSLENFTNFQLNPNFKDENISSLKMEFHENGESKDVAISPKILERILEYFKLNVHSNLDSFEGFDCGAFVCFVSNIELNYYVPNFNFRNQKPKEGDVIVLTEEGDLPNSIKHWAIYLGNNTYISKFGETHNQNSAFVDCMNFENMMKLYSCTNYFVAITKEGATNWNGYKKRN